MVNNEKKWVKPVILASVSPRRKELLAQIGVSFTTTPADVNEEMLPGERPEQYAVRVATEKALAVSANLQQGVVIAADTVVVVGDDVLGKPQDAQSAERMLLLLSGREHQVITGLVVRDVDSGKTISRAAVTKVWFRPLSRHEISAYVATGEPFDKAGGYGIQARAALFVKRLEGCYFNVVGLPLSILGTMLGEQGVELW